MSEISQDLDRIKERISDDSFLSNKGLSNEVGIHVFCYEPEDEIAVRAYIDRLVSEPSDKFHIIEYDLYKIFLKMLEDKRILKSAAKIEERKGKNFLLQELQNLATPQAFVERMKYEPHEPGDVIFLTGLGKVYPFMRSHSVLDTMQPFFGDVPVVVFYPGKYNGQDLNLFNRFFDGHYYRAFNLL